MVLKGCESVTVGSRGAVRVSAAEAAGKWTKQVTTRQDDKVFRGEMEELTLFK